MSRHRLALVKIMASRDRERYRCKGVQKTCIKTSIRIVFGKKINGHSAIIETASKGRKSIHTRTAWQNTTEEYMRKYKKVDASATQNRASAKSGQDTGASTATLTEKG